MASYRHLARIAAMQALFAYEFRGDVDANKTLAYCTEEFKDRLTDISFAANVLKGVLKNMDKISEVMQHEAPEWPIERIAPIDRAILSIGIYEILFSKDVPPIVAINEGVEIAKSYGDTNSAKFINGVLSAVMHKYRPESVNDKGKKSKIVIK